MLTLTVTLTLALALPSPSPSSPSSPLPSHPHPHPHPLTLTLTLPSLQPHFQPPPLPSPYPTLTLALILTLVPTLFLSVRAYVCVFGVWCSVCWCAVQCVFSHTAGSGGDVCCVCAHASPWYCCKFCETCARISYYSATGRKF